MPRAGRAPKPGKGGAGRARRKPTPFVPKKATPKPIPPSTSPPPPKKKKRVLPGKATTPKGEYTPPAGNTARLRQMAQDAANEGKLALAANLMKTAIERYPDNPGSMLRRRDIAGMTKRIVAWQGG